MTRTRRLLSFAATQVLRLGVLVVVTGICGLTLVQQAGRFGLWWVELTRGDDADFMQRMTKWIAANNVAYHVYWDYEAPDYNAKLSNGQYPKSAEVFRQAYGQR